MRTVCPSGRRYETYHSNEEWQTLKKNALVSLQLSEPTFAGIPREDMNRTLRMVKQPTYKPALPRVSQLSAEERMAVEEKNIVSCLSYSSNKLGLNQRLRMISKETLPGIKQFDLSGKTAIITGGSKGLGFAMAAGLASAGANVMLVNRNAEEGARAAGELSQDFGVKALSFSADITSQEQTEAMVQAAIDAFGRIDILINSAGINIRGPIDEVTLEDFNKVMTANVTGTWLCCRAVTPFMKKAGRGSIINLASTLGVVGLANRTPYTSSKGAVVQMTRALALELASHNITVNAICPGPFLTDMNLPIADTEEGKKFIVGATALGRWGHLREIQGAAIFLASDAATYMVGSLLTVDGGWTAK